MFSVASETQLPVASSSIDLVAAAQAVHWFQPIDAFYKEAHRVLKPHGCLAVYGYGVPKLKYQAKEEHLNEVFQEVFC